MSMGSADLARQEKLRGLLQSTLETGEFERLGAALISDFLGLGIAVAKSGFQFGGDAGPAGRRGRRFRLEAKRYADNTALRDRELLGEIDEAVARDQALEAWCLLSTRDVDEQLETKLFLKGLAVGVPVLILDFKKDHPSALAALCAAAPKVVEQFASADAAQLSAELAPALAAEIARLRLDFQEWRLGFEQVRAAGADRLRQIWQQPREAVAVLGQDAAGGNQRPLILRPGVDAALTNWWEKAPPDSPAVVVGYEGMGKTWASLDWLVRGLDGQPIVLVVPAAALAGIVSADSIGLRNFLGERLFEVMKVRDAAHWSLRLERLLHRPLSEGPLLTILFDGMNQAPSAPWSSLLQVLQAEPFAGRVRILASTREHHLSRRLATLSSLVVAPTLARVELYDDAPGGEFDQMLSLVGLSRDDLSPEVIPLARTPRLFSLVVRLRDKLVDVGKVTPHRLLWEYARDSFAAQFGRAFSEADWRDWLQEIARDRRRGVAKYTLRELGETADRSDLTPHDVEARLSDILDAKFAVPDASGDLNLTPALVYHALGAALLRWLEGIATTQADTLEVRLNEWLDPIAGFDEQAEILRAAVSIMVARGPMHEAVAKTLVTGWLHAQNFPEDHAAEISNLAGELVDPLLEAMQRSRDPSRRGALLVALNALRRAAHADPTARTTIVAQAVDWLRIVPREVVAPSDRHATFEASRSRRFLDRVGIDASCEKTVLGVPLRFVDNVYQVPSQVVASLLDGLPLFEAARVFEAAAIHFAVRGKCEQWEALRWIVLLNEVDGPAIANELRRLSGEVAARVPEAGVHRDLPARVAALLLWMTGNASDDAAAVALNPDIDRNFDYDRDYLADPGQSFFALERRHAEAVLSDASLSIITRIKRAKHLLLDPTFPAPQPFIDELRATALSMSVDELDAFMSRTPADIAFETLQPALARFAPDSLAALVRRKLSHFATRPLEQRKWSAIHALEHSILIDQPSREALTSLDARGREPDDGDERFVRTQILMAEAASLDPMAQREILIASGLGVFYLDWDIVLKPLAAAESDELVRRHGAGSAKQRADLLTILSLGEIAVGEESWTWLEGLASDEGFEARHVAWQILSQVDPRRFGRKLFDDGWGWSPTFDVRINHYGTIALAEGSLASPFDQVVSRIAPWLLSWSCARRDGTREDYRLAADVLDSIVRDVRTEAPQLAVSMSIDKQDVPREPTYFSARFEKQEPDWSSRAEITAALDVDATMLHRRRALESAIAKTKEARAAGAPLFLVETSVEGFAALCRSAPEIVDGWLEGAQERTADFRSRVLRAEGFYLALCEALLAVAPAKGCVLWTALRRIMATQFIGAAHIASLTHLVFTAPPSDHVKTLQADLLSLDVTDNDELLASVAIAAQLAGRRDWLQATITEDAASSLPWRRRRAGVLSGLCFEGRIEEPQAWPQSQLRAEAEILAHHAATSRFLDSVSAHWWRAFLAADNEVDAYAAWVLATCSTGRMSAARIRNELGDIKEDAGLGQRKRVHVALNLRHLDDAVEKREKDMSKSFLERRTIQGVGPWGRHRP